MVQVVMSPEPRDPSGWLKRKFKFCSMIVKQFTAPGDYLQ